MASRQSTASMGIPTTTANTTINNQDPPGPYELLPKPDFPKRVPSTKIIYPPSMQNKKEENAVVTENDGGENDTQSSTGIRKQLGCRRNQDDIFSNSDDDCENDNETNNLSNRRKLVFTSPRLIASDTDLFPANHSPYKKSDERWKQISNQAGSHRQDGSVVAIGRKVTPMALRIGMTKQAATRVRCLNLWLDHDKDILPEWLDVISQIFINLEHLTLTEDLFPGEDEMAVSARMRRLYILYRLPYLKSIDDMIVTPDERKMARPNEKDPNGDRVNKSEWIQNQTSLLLDDEDDDDDDGAADVTEYDYRHGHHLPVELVRDQSCLVENVELTASRLGNILDDTDDEIDGEEAGQIPKIPATLSNASVGTAKEVGVEVNQELAAKFAELSHISMTATTTDSTTSQTEVLDSETINDQLTGTSVVSDLASSSYENESSTHHYEEICQYSSGEGAEVFQVANFLHQVDAGTVDMMGKFDPIDAGAVPMTNADTMNSNGKNNADNTPVQMRRLKSRVHDDTTDHSIEIVSVASTDVEWSAACGVLTFRSDRACAPRLRMPFYSRNRKVVAADTSVQAVRQAKANLRNKQREKENKSRKSCPPVPRHSSTTVKTPQVGCCSLRLDGTCDSKFFPSNQRTTGKITATQETNSNISANKQLPPSKSLSSPFPMQFRERQKTPPRATPLVVKTIGSTDSGMHSSKIREMETISSPLQTISTGPSSPRNVEANTIKSASKGDLPPTCPSGCRRQVRVICTSGTVRKSKRHLRRMKASKENARSTSVMDLEDDDEDEEGEVDCVEIRPEGNDQSHDSDEDSLTYSET